MSMIAVWAAAAGAADGAAAPLPAPRLGLFLGQDDLGALRRNAGKTPEGRRFRDATLKAADAWVGPLG